MNKLNQKGFAHLAVVVIAVLVLGVVGFVGYKVYKERNINAKAMSNIPAVGSGNGIEVRMCYGTTGTGAAYRKEIFWNSGSTVVYYWRGTSTSKRTLNPYAQEITYWSGNIVVGYSGTVTITSNRPGKTASSFTIYNQPIVRCPN